MASHAQVTLCQGTTMASANACLMSQPPGQWFTIQEQFSERKPVAGLNNEVKCVALRQSG